MLWHELSLVYFIFLCNLENESERAALVDADVIDAATSLISASYLPLHQRLAEDHSTLFLPSALPSMYSTVVEFN